MRLTTRRVFVVALSGVLYGIVGLSPTAVASMPDRADRQALPRHFLTGYWHNFVNAAGALRLSDAPVEYDLMAVAFGEAPDTPGEVSFAVDPELSDALGGYTDDDLKVDIQALHDEERAVILSVGGELGQGSVDFITALACIQLENGLRSDKVALGLPTGPGAAGGGFADTVDPHLDTLP